MQIYCQVQRGGAVAGYTMGSRGSLNSRTPPAVEKIQLLEQMVFVFVFLRVDWVKGDSRRLDLLARAGNQRVFFPSIGDQTERDP